MSVDTPTAPLSSGRTGFRSRLAVTPFVAAMALSAALLFAVQPMFARMCLPLLGGSTSVWAIAMGFFQTMLLAGYAYAHFSNRWLPPRMAVMIHLGLLVFAAALLPVAAPQASGNTDTSQAGLWLFWIFAKSIGFPFFVLSATAPLLQSWFARTSHRSAANPYFLYAASNIGSIGALLAYPSLIEPMAGLASQSAAWKAGYCILVAAIAVCGVSQLRAITQLDVTERPAAESAPTFKRRLYWVTMAFIPSALLVAWTNRITADIASAPFLWLPPLILFLLTFIVVFRDRPLLTLERARVVQALCFASSYVVPVTLSSFLLVALLVISAALFFSTAVICHRQLYESRPAPSHLTEFYMLMSLGGVLGGIFVSLLAPKIFSSIAEYQLLLVMGLLAGNDIWTRVSLGKFRQNQMWALAACLLSALACFGLGRLTSLQIHNPVELLALSSAGILLVAAGAVLQGEMALIACALLLYQQPPQKFLEARNYFGVTSITDSARPGYRLFMHGTTIHGAESVADVTGLASQKPSPLVYYAPQGGMARSLRAAQDSLKLAGRNGNYAIVGLGVGSIACYRQAGDHMTFFEIDPDIIRLATNPQYFTYLSSCAHAAEIIEGDARLSLQQMQGRRFDYMLIDAFSSDTIPVHLLTREALELYLSRLEPDGMLVLHLSNRFMNLLPVVQATAEATGQNLFNRAILYAPKAGAALESPSIVVAFSRNEAGLKLLDKDTDVAALSAAASLPTAWTDDYANVPAAIFRTFMKSH